MTTEVRARSEKIAKTLDKAGLVTDPYKRGPVASNLFTLNLNPKNTLRVWAAGEVDLSTDRRHRQAVITATEYRRKLTRRYHIDFWGVKEDSDAARSQAIRTFPVQIPGGKLLTRDVRILSGLVSSVYSRQDVEVEATMTAPAMHQSFLMGFDETRQFIAMLPENCDTVAEAHDVLRPKGVKPDTLRQGEFFFVPVTTKEHEQLEMKLYRQGPTLRPLEGWQYGIFSTHHSLTLLLGKQLYATGLVWDTRQGRHEPLHLDDWHRVVRNREVVVRAQARARYWD